MVALQQIVPDVPVAGVTVDFITGLVTGRRGTAELTLLERKVLTVHLHYTDQVLPKPQVLRLIYGTGAWPKAKILDIVYHRLRQKLLAAGANYDCLQSVWARGHQLVSIAPAAGAAATHVPNRCERLGLPCPRSGRWSPKMKRAAIAMVSDGTLDIELLMATYAISATEWQLWHAERDQWQQKMALRQARR